jgi:hypothetical protein
VLAGMDCHNPATNRRSSRTISQSRKWAHSLMHEPTIRQESEAAFVSDILSGAEKLCGERMLDGPGIVKFQRRLRQNVYIISGLS